MFLAIAASKNQMKKIDDIFAFFTATLELHATTVRT